MRIPSFRRRTDLDDDLRAARPQPRPEFAAAVVDGVEKATGRRRRSTLRPVLVPLASVAVFLALTAISLAAAGQGGRLGAALEAVKGLGPGGQGSPPSVQQYVGEEGCTPGFWKNHTEDWQGYSPSQTLGSVFTIPAEYSSLSSVTLLAALSLGGGPTELDAAGLLLHHAVAALLNAAHSDVDYPLSTSQVISATNTALASSDRDTMLAQKDAFDELNNAGCPL